MPEEENWLSKRAVAVPTDCIRTWRQGPRPASSGEPVSVPMGMDRSVVDTSAMRCRISSAMAACRRLNSAMLLFSAVTRPSASLSKDTSRP